MFLQISNVVSYLLIPTLYEPYDEQNTRFLQMLEEETVTPNSREFCPIMNVVFQMLEEETMSTCHSEFYDSCTDEK